MKSLLYRKKWYLKHRATHWILSQTAANSVAQMTHGIKFVQRGDRIDWNESQAKSSYFYVYRIVSLEDLRKKANYSIEILSGAKEILLLNEHIVIKKANQRDIYDVEFCATDKGRIAYEDEYYITEENERIHRSITRVSNWLTPILTLVVACLALYTGCHQNSKSNANTTMTITSPK